MPTTDTYKVNCFSKNTLSVTFKQWIVITVAGKSHWRARLYHWTWRAAQEQINMLQAACAELVTCNDNNTLMAVAHQCTAPQAQHNALYTYHSLHSHTRKAVHWECFKIIPEISKLHKSNANFAHLVFTGPINIRQLVHSSTVTDAKWSNTKMLLFCNIQNTYKIISDIKNKHKISQNNGKMMHSEMPVATSWPVWSQHSTNHSIKNNLTNI